MKELNWLHLSLKNEIQFPPKVYFALYIQGIPLKTPKVTENHQKCLKTQQFCWYLTAPVLHFHINEHRAFWNTLPCMPLQETFSQIYLEVYGSFYPQVSNSVLYQAAKLSFNLRLQYFILNQVFCLVWGILIDYGWIIKFLARLRLKPKVVNSTYFRFFIHN